jgi:hypothetical protein
MLVEKRGHSVGKISDVFRRKVNAFNKQIEIFGKK